MTDIGKTGLLLLALTLLGSCDAERPRSGGHDHGTPPPGEQRLHVDDRVRLNLGLTLVEARSGRLDPVMEIPGEIISRPERRWVVRAPLSGTVTAIAAPWHEVRKGDVVAEIASSGLAEWQAELHAELTRAEEARLELAAARENERPLRTLADTLDGALAQARSGLADRLTIVERARAFAVSAENRLAELDALRSGDAVSEATHLEWRRETAAARRQVTESEEALRAARIAAAELDVRAGEARAAVTRFERRMALLERRVAAAVSAFEIELDAVAAACGVGAGVLSVVVDGAPAWARMSRIAIRSPGDGVVVAVHAGLQTFSERDGELVTVLDGSELLFTGRVPESEAARLPAELAVVVAVAGSGEGRSVKAAALRPVADGGTRTVLVEAVLDNSDGALRPGTSATARVSLGLDRPPRLLLPSACVVRDGLEAVVFVQDDDDPHDIIRQPVTVGESSGGMTEIVAGVDRGARVVLAGANQLRYAEADDEGGGHVHSDGTFHEGH